VKFRAITVENWRGFNGTFSIKFSTDPDRPLTVLYGPNGAGKTSLLNAFTWCLFNEFTLGFRDAELLINNEAITNALPGEEVRAKVAVEFNHDGKEYMVRRSAWVTRRDTHEATHQTMKDDWSDQRVTAKLPDGQTANLERADIAKIYPRGVWEMFFLASESFQRFSLTGTEEDSVSTGAEKVIQSLLDFDIYQSARDDLAGAKSHRRLKVAQRNVTDSAETRAQESLDKAEDQLKTCLNLQQKLPNHIEEAEKALAKASAKAQDHNPEEVRKHKKLTAQKTMAKEETKAAAQAAAEHHRRILGDWAWKALVPDLVSEALSLFDQAEEAGRMPPPITESLLEALISKGKCICRRDLDDADVGKLERFRENFHDDRLTRAAGDARTSTAEWRLETLRGIETLHRDLHDHESTPALVPDPGTDPEKVVTGDLLRAYRDLAGLAAEAARAAEDDYDTYMKQHPDGSEGERLIAEVKSKQREVDGLKQRLEAAKAAEEGLRQDVNTAKEHRRKVVGNKAENQKKMDALDIIDEAEQFLTRFNREFINLGRADLEREVNRLYKKLMARNYEVAVTEDFSLQAFDANGARVAASTSESVMLTVAFLGALALIAPEYRNMALDEDNNYEGLGSIDTSATEGFPVVLDAPYSPLGERYSRTFTKQLPTLLGQMMMVVEKDAKQYLDDVDDSVGAIYLLQLETSDTEGHEETTFEWNGEEYPYETVVGAGLGDRSSMTVLRKAE
jgi:DNA sulfur modification protein DndD